MNATTVSYDCIRSYRKVQEAVTLSNDILRSPEFYTRISKQPRFHLASIPSDVIAGLMYDARIKMNVDLYYSVSPIKNIDGYDDLQNPNLIHLNTWKIDRSVASLCNSIIHRCVHAVNAQVNKYYFNKYYFGHDANVFYSLEKTAPHAIGAIAQKMISDEDVILMEHDPFIASINEVPKRTFGLFAI